MAKQLLQSAMKVHGVGPDLISRGDAMKKIC